MNKKETEVEVFPLRDLPYKDAKKEIIEYAQNAGKKKVYVSEIVKKLRLDDELVAEILRKWRDCKCRDLCNEDGFYGYTSYTCPVMSCQYNNYAVRWEKDNEGEINK